MNSNIQKYADRKKNLCSVIFLYIVSIDLWNKIYGLWGVILPIVLVYG